MPLVTCPCEQMAPMKQVQRDGVEIDVCTKCRGVWLDRGELEKLLAVVRAADAEDAQASAAQQRPPQHPYPPQAAPQSYPPQAPQQPYPPHGAHPSHTPPGYYGERGEYGEYGERGEGYDPRYGYKKKKRFDIFDIFD